MTAAAPTVAATISAVGFAGRRSGSRGPTSVKLYTFLLMLALLGSTLWGFYYVVRQWEHPIPGTYISMVSTIVPLVLLVILFAMVVSGK